jgi:soluble lytic murein transglycosylase-like protein
MQLMPDTFTWLTNDKLRDRLAQGMLYDPETSIKYGAYYLSFLYSQYNNWDTVLAAYNAGPGNVDSWLADERYDNDQDGVLDKIPFKETNNYVKKVNRALQAYDELYE